MNLKRTAAISLVLAAAAILAAPYLRADRFGYRVKNALENALGRRVEIGTVRLSLLRGPAFLVEHVVIHDDPAFGVEPFAWVDQLEASPRLLPLLRGRLEFSSIRLSGLPVVNFVKNGGWNVAPLISADRIAGLPKITVRGARLYFKLGGTKSVFYLTNVNLDASPPAQRGGAWEMKFTGEPARTDRAIAIGGAGRGMGRLSGSARLQGSEPHLDIDLILSRSPLGEMIALVYGRDIGVHGVVSSRSRLQGPLDALAISGQLDVEEIHRWDRMPLWGHSWRVSLRGALDLVNQDLSVESFGPPDDPAPLSIRFDVSRYLTQPDWRLGFAWSDFPLSPLVPIVRQLGLPLPQGTRMTGVVDGAVTISRRDMLDGSLTLRDGELAWSGGPPVRFRAAEFLLHRDTVTLSPVRVEIADQGAVQVQTSYTYLGGLFSAAFVTDGLQAKALPLEGLGLPEPLPAAIQGARWRGELRYRQERDSPGVWSGQLAIADASFPVPGLAAPVHVRDATLSLNGANWRLRDVRASAAGLEFTGDYDAGASRFRLRFGEADLTRLEALLEPALQRPRSFFSRTLRLDRHPVPRWLASRRLEGEIAANALILGPARLSGVAGRVLWTGARIELRQVRASLEGGTLLANGSVDLSGAQPQYAVNVLGERIAWRKGLVDIEGDFAASGLGAALLETLHAEGSFEVGGVLPGFDSLAGCYRLDLSRAPRLRLTELRATTGGDLYLGTGALREDGTLLVQLDSGGRQLRVVGTLAGLRIEQPPGWSADPN